MASIAGYTDSNDSELSGGDIGVASDYSGCGCFVEGVEGSKEAGGTKKGHPNGVALSILIYPYEMALNQR